MPSRGSIKRYDVRLSIRPFDRPAWALAAHPLLQVCCCGPGGQEISIHRYTGGVQWAYAGSATLSAYVGSKTQTCFMCIVQAYYGITAQYNDV